MSPSAATSIGFLGAGNMAEAIARGVLRAGLVEPAEVWMTDVRTERLAELAASLGVSTAPDSRDILQHTDTILLAVKPQNLPDIVAGLAGLVQTRHLIVSILAGVRAGKIEDGLAHDGCPRVRVVRAMPNTPALVLEGATAICPGNHATRDDLERARSLFDAVGQTEIIEPAMMDAITGLTGSGPAYVFRLIEVLVDAGVAEGLPRETAEKLVKQMVHGSAMMARDSNDDPAELRRRVTSPGGTTAAGLDVMEQREFAAMMAEVVAAATRRSRELGEG